MLFYIHKMLIIHRVTKREPVYVKVCKGGVKVHKLQQKMHHDVIFLCKNLVEKHKKHTFAAEKHENRKWETHTESGFLYLIVFSET